MSSLNALLADEQSRYRTADSVLTWWLRDGSLLPVIDWLNKPEPGQVEQLLREPHEPRRAGAPGKIDAGAFCAVTLSVNQSRVVVRDWLEVPLRDLQSRLARWYADHAVAGLWKTARRSSRYG